MAINWPAVLGRVVTATGWTYEQLYEASMCDVLELLAYWKEEPPSHVLLALRYLGPSRNASRPLNVAQARKDLGDLAPLLGGAEQKLPDDLKKMVQAAQEMKEKFKGL